MAKKRCGHCKDRKDTEAGINTPLKWFCSYDCASQFAIDKRAKAKERAARKRLKNGREKLKSNSDRLAEAQTEINKYVRARDYYLPCISCGKHYAQGQRHAGHYRSRGACSQLRYNLFNIHAQCAVCNSMKSGNLIEYRIALVEKIGERVEWLESQNEVTRYTSDYLIRMKKIFARRANLTMKRRVLSGSPQ